MNVLLHVCCGPCAIYPLSIIRKQGHEAQGYFVNPNIHPFKEFQRRIETLETMSQQLKFEVEFERQYGLREFLRQTVFHEESRCGLCYAMRLRPTAERAVAIGADAFSSTLLYSRFQNHALLRQQGDSLAAELGIAFYYEDFRTGWQKGIDQSVAMGLYRQPYCGCIYSEQERYDKLWKKAAEKRTNKDK
ncbi:MAG: epoxyqueuosine reductase QueH [Proteobacteria bacterium]|nr:epoxyqueuosine reductase QueH [Desulfobulbaceae bacterium]MBU4151818.1 epoxyqueuosine reductase QueH [Pseudomonadota bacterium]MDP2106954.1 epoxyqueuosine reductase QueH [Desulfobulbaceae bacterium]